MKIISREEYDELCNFMLPHVLELWKHENENAHVQDYTQTGFPINQIYKYELKDENLIIYILYNTLFLSTISTFIPKAIEKTPQNFGTGDAMDVMKALYDVSNYDFGNLKDFIDCLRDIPCYIIYKKDGTFSDDILRLDLYRDIKPAKDRGGYDFVGGLLHALKHFSMNGINLSYGNDINETFDIMHVVYLIAMSFRNKTGMNDCYKAIQIIRNKEKEYKLIYHLYKEVETGIFFIRTCHKKSK